MAIFNSYVSLPEGKWESVDEAMNGFHVYPSLEQTKR